MNNMKAKMEKLLTESYDNSSVCPANKRRIDIFVNEENTKKNTYDINLSIKDRKHLNEKPQKKAKPSESAVWHDIDSKLKSLHCRSNSTTNSSKAMKLEMKSKGKGIDTSKRKPYKYNKFMELISVSKDLPFQNQKTKNGIKEINRLLSSDLAYSQLLTSSNDTSTKQSDLFHHKSCSSLTKPKSSVYNALINNISSSTNAPHRLNSKSKDPLSISSSVNTFEEKKALDDFCKSFDVILSKKQAKAKNANSKKLRAPFEEVTKGKKDLFYDI